MPSLEDFKQTQWFKNRPKKIKKLICEFPYASTVMIKDTLQFAYVYSWFEDMTVSVIIMQEDNPHTRNALPDTYRVFGYKPTDLLFLKRNDSIILEDW